MIPVLVFDIETVPDVAGLRVLRNHPEALSDAQVAQAAFDARREQSGSDFLPLHLQRVVAIGCLLRDDRGYTARCLGQPGDSEAKLLQLFFRLIDHCTPQIVSWNGGGFDLQVMHYRALMHGVTAARYWETGQDDRDFKWNNYLSRYHTRHLDLMDQLALHAPRASAPLDELARLCGFPGKLGMDGAQVWPTFMAGGIDEIRAYCETDIANTYLLFCQFQLLRGQWTAERHDTELKLLREHLESLDGQHWHEFLERWERRT